MAAAEALVAPSASAQRAAAADRAPPSPALGYGFPRWAPKGREGDGGSERSERRGKGERAAIAARE